MIRSASSLLLAQYPLDTTPTLAPILFAASEIILISLGLKKGSPPVRPICVIVPCRSFNCDAILETIFVSISTPPEDNASTKQCSHFKGQRFVNEMVRH